MVTIEKPHIEITKANDDGRYALFKIGPFERGYGTTVGNSLRRVMLSSMPGMAVSSVKIDGVLHEFSNLPDLKEDALDIILNIKRLAFRNNTDNYENQKAYIEVTGKRDVTGADVKLSSDIEVVNKDLHIATLSSDSSKFCMEMTLTCGKGYISAEQNKSISDEIGVIAVDSIYTPIERVNFNVENMRVGDITDYDKLIFEIWTNGAMSSVEVLSCAAQIIRNQLEVFVDLSGTRYKCIDCNTEGLDSGNDMFGKDLGALGESILDNKISVSENVKGQPIEDFDFSVRSYNCLKRAGVNTIGDLLNKTNDEMLKLRNLGKKSYEEIMGKLDSLGLKLKEEEE